MRWKLYCIENGKEYFVGSFPTRLELEVAKARLKREDNPMDAVRYIIRQTLRRWELRSLDLGSGVTAHVSWHTTEPRARSAAQYWTDRSINNDGAREDTGIRFYVRATEAVQEIPSSMGIGGKKGRAA